MTYLQQAHLLLYVICLRSHGQRPMPTLLPNTQPQENELEPSKPKHLVDELLRRRINSTVSDKIYKQRVLENAAQRKGHAQVRKTPFKFDVVAFTGADVRIQFDTLLSRLDCPNDSKGQVDWQSHKANISACWELGAPQKMLPVIAVRSTMPWTPCAAATYAGMEEDENTFVLLRLIESPQYDCKGAGATILCPMIRHSSNKEGGFTPLHITDVQDSEQKRYYESFGCEGNLTMKCFDPQPQRCEALHDRPYFDATSYEFHEFLESHSGNPFWKRWKGGRRSKRAAVDDAPDEPPAKRARAASRGFTLYQFPWKWFGTR